jgi:type IV pilus assembly protein PilP
MLTGACAWAVFSLLGVTHGVAQTPESVGEDTYHYDPTRKRDPFVSPFRSTSDEQPIPEEARTPLQRFDIGQLKLVGIIWETVEPKALIEDSEGLGYIVTRGTLIGSKGGVIKVIEPRRVVVEEYEADFYGKRRAQERELPLSVIESAKEKRTPKTAQ